MKFENRNIVSEAIELLMKNKKWNITKFAENTGKSSSEIEGWLSGTHNFTIDELTEISVIFETTISNLTIQNHL